MGIFVTTAFASPAGGEDSPPALIVNTAWLDGETIRIDVTDPETGTRSAIAVPLSAYLREGENIEFISIQAVDVNGRQSGVIEIRNPFFNPNLPQGNIADDAEGNNVDGTNGNNNNNTGNGHGENSPTADSPNIGGGLRPLTPDGTGTVIDNVTDRDGGREFFTINSDDGSEFFLIIDRHRNVDNVYFLNAVTLEDLMSLARDVGRELPNNSVSAIPVPPQVSETDEQATQETQPTPEPETADERPSALRQIGSNLFFFIGIIVVVGGIAYYFKVVRPKKNSFADSYDDEPDDYDYDNAADDDTDNEDGDDD